MNKFAKIIAATAGAALLAATAFSAAAADANETKTASGIVITTLKQGSGASPRSSETVKVHYRGVLESGKEFDSSYGRGQPASFPLNRVIPCWTEGMQTMKVGGKARLLCPSALAYGSRGVPGTIPPDAALIFEVELLEIVK
jgi:FKBP-type peptidyl-prolyl cis-trans isomerase FkpA